MSWFWILVAFYSFGAFLESFLNSVGVMGKPAMVRSSAGGGNFPNRGSGACGPFRLPRGSDQAGLDL